MSDPPPISSPPNKDVTGSDWSSAIDAGNSQDTNSNDASIHEQTDKEQSPKVPRLPKRTHKDTLGNERWNDYANIPNQLRPDLSLIQLFVKSEVTFNLVTSKSNTNSNDNSYMESSTAEMPELVQQTPVTSFPERVSQETKAKQPQKKPVKKRGRPCNSDRAKRRAEEIEARKRAEPEIQHIPLRRSSRRVIRTTFFADGDETTETESEQKDYRESSALLPEVVDSNIDDDQIASDEMIIDPEQIAQFDHDTLKKYATICKFQVGADIDASFRHLANCDYSMAKALETINDDASYLKASIIGKDGPGNWSSVELKGLMRSMNNNKLYKHMHKIQKQLPGKSTSNVVNAYYALKKDVCSFGRDFNLCSKMKNNDKKPLNENICSTVCKSKSQSMEDDTNSYLCPLCLLYNGYDSNSRIANLPCTLDDLEHPECGYTRMQCSQISPYFPDVGIIGQEIYILKGSDIERLKTLAVEQKWKLDPILLNGSFIVDLFYAVAMDYPLVNESFDVFIKASDGSLNKLPRAPLQIASSKSTTVLAEPYSDIKYFRYEQLQLLDNELEVGEESTGGVTNAESLSTQNLSQGIDSVSHVESAENESNNAVANYEGFTESSLIPKVNDDSCSPTADFNGGNPFLNKECDIIASEEKEILCETSDYDDQLEVKQLLDTLLEIVVNYVDNGTTCIQLSNECGEVDTIVATSPANGLDQGQKTLKPLENIDVYFYGYYNDGKQDIVVRPSNSWIRNYTCRSVHLPEGLPLTPTEFHQDTKKIHCEDGKWKTPKEIIKPNDFLSKMVMLRSYFNNRKSIYATAEDLNIPVSLLKATLLEGDKDLSLAMYYRQVEPHFRQMSRRNGKKPKKEQSIPPARPEIQNYHTSEIITTVHKLGFEASIGCSFEELQSELDAENAKLEALRQVRLVPASTEAVAEFIADEEVSTSPESEIVDGSKIQSISPEPINDFILEKVQSPAAKSDSVEEKQVDVKMETEPTMDKMENTQRTDDDMYNEAGQTKHDEMVADDGIDING